jgi:hypothetical protein
VKHRRLRITVIEERNEAKGPSLDVVIFVDDDDDGVGGNFR